MGIVLDSLTVPDCLDNTPDFNWFNNDRRISENKKTWDKINNIACISCISLILSTGLAWVHILVVIIITLSLSS